MTKGHFCVPPALPVLLASNAKTTHFHRPGAAGAGKLGLSLLRDIKPLALSLVQGLCSVGTAGYPAAN